MGMMAPLTGDERSLKDEYGECFGEYRNIVIEQCAVASVSMKSIGASLLVS